MLLSLAFILDLADAAMAQTVTSTSGAINGRVGDNTSGILGVKLDW